MDTRPGADYAARMRILPLLLALGAATPHGASAQVAAEPAAGVPAYLPRGAFLGAYVNQGAVVPQGRIFWQVTLVQTRNDALVAAFGGGGGFALTRPQGVSRSGVPYTMESLYEHTLLVGLAYRATYANNFHWGFHFLTGPVFYGATYDTLPAESRWDGNVEGTLEIGIKVGEVTFGATGGWAQPYNTLIDSTVVSYVGGPMFGVFLDWRPLPKR